MLNGAPTFMTLVDRAPRPARSAQSNCPPRGRASRPRCSPISGTPNAYRADDFDTLVDSPIITGNPVTREFTVDGKQPRAGA